MNIGGGGLGYRERPGLGSEGSVSRLLLAKVWSGVVVLCGDVVCVCLQERSSSSSSMFSSTSSTSCSSSSLEGYSKPSAGALGDRMNAMKQAFQVLTVHHSTQSSE